MTSPIRLASTVAGSGPPVIVLPLGPAGGASQLPGQDEIGTAELTSQIKGRDMMIDRYADLLHVEH